MDETANTISAEGLAKAEDELRELREFRRPAIVAAIKAARADGDLSENAEYHAAREDQALNEARIRTLEHHIAHAEVTEGGDGSTAAVGSTVSYRDIELGELSEVTLVHSLEVDIAGGRISADGPIGRALLGTSPGDRVTVETPRGSKNLEVVAVRC